MIRGSQTGLYRSMVFALAGIALAISPSNIFATALPITDSGILQIANLQGTVAGITAVPNCINWGGGSTCVAGTTHQMGVSGSSNLFSTTASATDQIKDLPSFPPPTLVDFQTVLGAGALAGQTINFDLVSIPTNGATTSGNCSSNAPLNSCTPAFSPYTFSMDVLGKSVKVQFSAVLNAYTGSSVSGSTPYVAVFTTEQAGTIVGVGACNGLAVNITNILACLAAGGTITGTWSAAEAPSGNAASSTVITRVFEAAAIPLNGTTSPGFNAAASLSGSTRGQTK